MNCYRWGFCHPSETSPKESLDLAAISNFHHRKPHGGLNSVPIDPTLKVLTTKLQISVWISCSLMYFHFSLLLVSLNEASDTKNSASSFMLSGGMFFYCLLFLYYLFCFIYKSRGNFPLKEENCTGRLVRISIFDLYAGFLVYFLVDFSVFYPRILNKIHVFASIHFITLWLYFFFILLYSIDRRCIQVFIWMASDGRWCHNRICPQVIIIF